MSTKIKLKKSSVLGKVPVLADLEFGELALNYTDGKLFYKKSNNTIAEISGGGGGGGGTPIPVLDEGVEITPSAQSINFTGAAVTATADGSGNVTVNVTGGGGSGGSAAIVKPTVFAPSGNSIRGPYTSSQFALLSGEDAHRASDWQFSTDPLFGSFTYQSLDDTANLTFIFVPEGTFLAGTTYYYRIRHKGFTGSTSEYSDAVSFVAQATPNTTFDVLSQSDSLHAVCENPTTSVYVAGSNLDGNLYRSIDGINFTKVFENPVTNFVTSSITYSPTLNRFLAIGQITNTTSSTAYYMYSDDDGITWVQGTFANTILRVCGEVKWVPFLGRFVAVGGFGTSTGAADTDTGQTSSGSVITSPDGINWTQYAPTTLNTQYKIAFSGTRVVTAGFNSEYVYSDNGLTWTTVANIAGVTTLTVAGLAYSPTLNLWVHIPFNTTTFYTSTDGITWTARTQPAVATPLTGTVRNGYLSSFDWYSDFSAFIGYIQGGDILESANGIAYTKHPQASGLHYKKDLDLLYKTFAGEVYERVSSTQYDLVQGGFVNTDFSAAREIAFDGTRFVATTNQGIIYSTDATGRYWRNTEITGVTNLYHVTYVNNRWRAYGTTTSYSSINGVNWVASASMPPSTNLQQIIFVPSINRYVALFSTNTPISATNNVFSIYTSSDGLVFTFRFTLPTQMNYKATSLEYSTSEQKLVIINDRTYTSTDGINWISEVPTGADNGELKDVVYSPFYGKIYACTSNTIYASKQANAANRFKLRRIYFDDNNYSQIVVGTGVNEGVIVAASLSGAISVSTDGVNFELVSSGLSSTIIRLRYLNGRFIATSSQGRISHSTDGVNWTAVTLLPNTTTVYDVAYSATSNRYVFANSASPFRSYYSTNLTTSIEATYDVSPQTSVFTVDYSSALNIFVHPCSQGYFYSSTDGITWTRRTPLNRPTNSINYELRYISQLSKFICTNTNSLVMSYSDNGIDWISTTTAFSGISSPIVGMYWSAVDSRLYFKQTSGALYYTPDGTTYTRELLPETAVSQATVHYVEADGVIAAYSGDYLLLTQLLSTIGFQQNLKRSGVWTLHRAVVSIRHSVNTPSGHLRYDTNTAIWKESVEDFYLNTTVSTTTPVIYNGAIHYNGDNFFATSQSAQDLAYSNDGENWLAFTYTGRAGATNQPLGISSSENNVIALNAATKNSPIMVTAPYNP